jgi:GT2 family glycosyltransferase
MNTDRLSIPKAARLSALPLSSLIICSRNRPTFLRETIASVLQGDEVPTELLVVDQSSAPDRYLASLQHGTACNLRYLKSQSVGLSRARNIGITAAQHDLLVVIDDDMFVAPNWFGTFVRALVDAEPRTVLTGRVLAAPAEVTRGFAPTLAIRETPALYQGRIGTEVLAGGHMAAHRCDLESIGGFDERLGAGTVFPAADDNDLGFRLLEAGYRIQYVPEAVIYHRAWRSERDYLPMRWNYGLGKGGYYAKYLSLRDPYMLRRLTYDIGHRIWGFPVRLWQKRHLAYGDPAYILGILVGAIRWLLIQRRSP